MKQKFTLYIMVSTSKFDAGTISVWPSDISGVSGVERMLIDKQEIELDVPEFDIVSVQVDGIEKQIARVRADAQVQINALEQRKQELLAISYDGATQ